MPAIYYVSINIIWRKRWTMICDKGSILKMFTVFQGLANGDRNDRYEIWEREGPTYKEVK